MKNSVNKTCCRILALANPTRLAIAEMLRDGPKKLIELERALITDMQSACEQVLPHRSKMLDRQAACGFQKKTSSQSFIHYPRIKSGEHLNLLVKKGGEFYSE